jgi:valyl-tRNA synthetase
MWETSGFFNPDTCIEQDITDKDADTFSIVLPPPNVTGTLHIGHAAMLAIEDTIVRFNRMQGKKTLWIPGTDHAAIATQSKVEKIIKDTEGKTRYDLGRTEFLKRVDAFAQDSHDTIVNQSKKMGASLDWSREAFTLDETRSRAVRTAFKKMYDDNLIYQGARIVNWDPIGQTVVSDDEIIYKEEITKFYYLQYGPFVIGTSRPETKFGDKYVVMHPDDKRYSKYTDGQKIELEWINGKITATIIKDEAIDMEFGSGVMTITPWHDITDFDIAKRHNLDYEQIIDFDGKLLDIAGEFAGQHILEARQNIIDKLQKQGLLVKVDNEYNHNIATAERTSGIIEPQIKKQWWIDVNKEFTQKNKRITLKKLMQSAVRDNLIDIIPKRFEKTYFHWIDNLRDWCISRQIWYGHRIPVWYCVTAKPDTKCSEPIVSTTDITKCPHCNGTVEQDSDTLDTWFSSGLWTFSTLGWPEKTDDFLTYHPTTLLETGYDILFFWVARMILMTRYLLDGNVPFKTVYLHGLIRDESGQKMSKSLGNVINPLDVNQKYGTDAVRLALMIGATPGNDAKMSEKKIEGYRNFSNKLWNIGRYITTQNISVNTKPSTNTAADEWILSRLAQVIKSITSHIENYRLSQAGEELRDFTWNEFADWYVEIHKIEKNDAVLLYVYKTLLKLWHPFIPFVTETIWQEMFEEKQLLMITNWPHTDEVSTSKENSFEIIKKLITEIRNIRTTYTVPASAKIDITLVTKNATFISKNEKLIKKLAHVKTITIQKNDEKFPESATAIFDKILLYVHLAGIIDITNELTRIQKELDKIQQYIHNLEKKLSNEHFVNKAPKDIVAKEKENLKNAQLKYTELANRLQNLKK